MPDDGPFGMIFGREPTPEERAEREEQIAQLHMKIEAERAAERDFFRTLSIEHLVMFNKILSNCRGYREPAEIIRWYQGRACAVLEIVHEVCIACGLDHTAEGLDSICEVQD